MRRIKKEKKNAKSWHRDEEWMERKINRKNPRRTFGRDWIFLHPDISNGYALKEYFFIGCFEVLWRKLHGLVDWNCVNWEELGL